MGELNQIIAQTAVGVAIITCVTTNQEAVKHKAFPLTISVLAGYGLGALIWFLVGAWWRFQ